VRRPHWILFIVVTVVLFYWKLVFTKQFTVLWEWEPVTQSYAWFNFAAAAIHKGILPIWDPFRFSGSTFIGEMQTGLFYPLKFLVYIMPLDGNGMVQERIYSLFYVLTHVLAAVFMFFLARHLRISSFGASIAGLSFTLGGYLANTAHPHTLDSGIWMPLIALFYLRSTEEASLTRALFFASLSGIALGMTVLGGGIHMTIMSGIVVATMAVVICMDVAQVSGYVPIRMFSLAAVVAVMGFMFAAVQLLPSLEYGPLAYRWVGGDAPVGFHNKIPYEWLGTLARFSPRSLFTFLFGAASPGNQTPSNYFGILPLFLCIVGAWRGWALRWVKYFTLVAVFSYLYTWGEFSFLHGVLYLVPGLDIAREAGRFILLTHFAMAILAGFGINELFGTAAPKDSGIRTFVRSLRWLTIFLTAVLVAGSVQKTIELDDSFFMSFVFIAASYVIFELIYRDRRTFPLHAAIVFLLLWDVYEFNYPVRNKTAMQAEKQDFMADLIDRKKLAQFLKSQPQPFRIHFDAQTPPNMGDSYGIPMTGGMSATMLTEYLPYLGHPMMDRLLNVGYTLRRTDLPGAQPVFFDGTWRVYKNLDAGERAWVVHQVVIDPSKERPLKGIYDPDFDPARVAILERRSDAPIDPEQGTGSPDVVEATRNEPMSMEFRVHSSGRGLLVASEVFYPGWRALVNGGTAEIYRVDGVLRGVFVPAGDSTVRFDYRPFSVGLGIALTLAASAAAIVLGIMALFKRGEPADERAVLRQMRMDWDRRAKENARHYVATEKTDWSDEKFFESGDIWIRYYIESILPEICGGRQTSDLRILEIGCGAGRMTRPLSKLFGRVDAVDVSPMMITSAREAVSDCANVHLHVNNGVDLSMFSDSQFDFAFSAIVFQHIPSRTVVENYIKETARVLRPRSVFKFQVQGRPIPENDANTWVGVGFSADEMREIASRCGFTIKDMQGAGTQDFWLTFVKMGRVH
jgi:SAM-dependent methyltransferase